ACAENMPGGNAQRPGDIVKAASGKTIEVITTDAEGRMVLADAVWYACQLGAKKVVDIATLTGAVIIALGKETAGIVANDDALAADVIKAGKFTGESYWQLPTYPEYFELIKSPVADLKNSGGRAGGCITGGLFIGEFIDKGVAWAHLDIGGTSSADKTAGFKPLGGTAFSVMTLVKLGELE
ncbi:MAG: leucyl aminopeptidase, partial [Phascolarctobacterium sp.]|nr:leucyl aminopeptidase [Candidatus Phascolarctobacterium equi]